MASQTASSRMSARAERRAIAALLAAFALLVQALIPSLAMAAEPASGAGVICSLLGAHAQHEGTPAPGHLSGGVCDHCICAFAAATPPASASPPAPVRYALHAAPDLPSPGGPAPGRGLAAPPPPSRGPPNLTA